MKKISIVVPMMLLLSMLASCAGNAPTPSPRIDTDALATIVTGTLSAILSATPSPKPTQTPAPTTTSPAPTHTSNLTLDDFPNTELLGENDHYSIYLINPTSGDNGKTGEIIVYDKNTNLVLKMNGSFTIFGTALVKDDGKGEYILLSVGTYTSRGAIVLSLAEQKQAVNTFCTSSGNPPGYPLFWNDYIIINNCDTIHNRPWGVGEAPSVTAINLKTGTETIIAKSDLTHQYAVKQIEGNTLQYIETYVENEADWQNQDKQRTDEKIYDLTSLGNN